MKGSEKASTSAVSSGRRMSRMPCFSRPRRRSLLGRWACRTLAAPASRFLEFPAGSLQPVTGICGTRTGGSPDACAVTARSCAMWASARARRWWLTEVRRSNRKNPS